MSKQMPSTIDIRVAMIAMLKLMDTGEEWVRSPFWSDSEQRRRLEAELIDARQHIRTLEQIRDAQLDD